MSLNAYARLRALLPPSPLLLAQVVQHHADDTSTVELPQGLGNVEIGQGLAVGTRLRVRGTSVPVGAFAFIRDGVVETRAPDGTPTDAVVGTVAAQPFGPPRLAAVTPGPALQTATVGTPYSLDMAPFFSDGYPPRAYALASGTLPSGLTLNAATGVLAGTATATAAQTTVQVRCTDSTHRQATVPVPIRAV